MQWQIYWLDLASKKVPILELFFILRYFRDVEKEEYSFQLQKDVD